MTTQLITVAPNDTLSHASNLFRQYQFHHLPVVKKREIIDTFQQSHDVLLFAGLLTTEDIDLALASAQHDCSTHLIQHPWQEQPVSEAMDSQPLCVSPATSVGAAARLLVERGLSCLPVVEYNEEKEKVPVLLVGLLTRSDLLLALARALGAFEPGMPLDISLPDGSMAPLTTTLHIAAELHVHVRSVIVVPSTDGIPQHATLYIDTIYPTPLLQHLQEAGITYTHAHPLEDEQKNPTNS